MAIPVIESTTVADTAGAQDGELVFTAPSGLANDDLILILCASAAVTANDWPTVSGYTQIKHADNSGNVQVSLYWKISNGSDGFPLTITEAGADEYATGICFRISGVDTTTPLNQTGSWVGVGTDGTGVTVTGVTTNVDDCLAIVLGGTDGGDVAPYTVTGTGWSSYSEDEHPDNDATGVTRFTGTKDMASQGATGSVTWDHFSGIADCSVGIQLAIAPAAGGSRHVLFVR